MARRLEAQRLADGGRKPVKNADLWQRLEAAAARHEVEWLWVKGHDGDPGNERADRLANRGLVEAVTASARVNGHNASPWRSGEQGSGSGTTWRLRRGPPSPVQAADGVVALHATDPASVFLALSGADGRADRARALSRPSTRTSHWFDSSVCAAPCSWCRERWCR